MYSDNFFPLHGSTNYCFQPIWGSLLRFLVLRLGFEGNAEYWV